MMLLAAQPTGFRAHAIYLVAAIPLLIAVVVAIVVWRNARRERTANELRLRLSDPNPAVRKRALDEVTDEVLSANAPLFRELLARERDEDVLDALAAAVARSRWEPTSDPDIVELRRWVAGATRTTISSTPASDERVGPTGAAFPTANQPASPATAGAPSLLVVPVEPAPAGPQAIAPGGHASTAASGLEELDGLIPKVRALLGDDLEHVELVSIDGEVLTSWRSSDAPTERT
jgi:hypothetical protein